jgi:hypothetical protein
MTGRWWPAALRWGLGAAGLAALGYGTSTLLTDPQVGDWQGVAEWLVFAVLLHDGVLAPAVLLLGAAVGARGRRRLRWVFLLAGSLTAVALPVLLRPRPTANPSVLPLDYVRGWALSLGTVVVLAVAWAAGRRLRRLGSGRGRDAGRAVARGLGAVVARGRTGGREP